MTMERTFEVRKSTRFKTRWVCLVFEPGDTTRNWTTGCTYDRHFKSKKHAQRFGEMVIEALGNT